MAYPSAVQELPVRHPFELNVTMSIRLDMISFGGRLIREAGLIHFIWAKSSLSIHEIASRIEWHATCCTVAGSGRSRAVSDELVPRRLTPPSFPPILASLLPSERPSETRRVVGRRRLQEEIAQPFCLLFTASDRDAMNSELSAISSTVKFLILIVGARETARGAVGAHAGRARCAETARDKWEFQSRLRRNRISRVPLLLPSSLPSLPLPLPPSSALAGRPRAFLIGAFDRTTDERRGERRSDELAALSAYRTFSSFARR